MSFTWIPYYKEFAQRLTQFQKDRKYGHEIEMYTVEQGEKRDKRQ